MMEKLILVAALLCASSSSSLAFSIQKRHSENTNNQTIMPLLECRDCGQIEHCTAPANPYGCQCDAECLVFNDCCESFSGDIETLQEECPHVFSDFPTSSYRCNSVVTNAQLKEIAVYMISECPRGWIKAGGDDELALRELVIAECQTTTNNHPPVSDFDTGFVYKNEFCALCHEVRSPVLWPILYSCSGTLTTIIPEEALTPQLLSEFCVSSYYYLPPFQFIRTPPRFCTPFVSTCLSEDDLYEVIETYGISYTDLLYACENGHQNLVGDDEVIFKNEHCALCNDYSMSEEDFQCFEDATHMFVPESELQVAVLLDVVDKVAQVTSVKTRFTSQVIDDCRPGTVFNANVNRCLETVCSFVTNGEPTSNNNCTDILAIISDGGKLQYPDTTETPNNNTKVLANSTGAPTNNTGSDGSEFTCQSVVAIEDASEYVAINQTLVFYKPLGVITLVIDMNPSQLPIVCLDLAIPFINPQTLRLFLILQRFYGGLVFVTSIISVVLCLLVVSVYLMRPMRSVFGVVVINIAVIFLVSDVVIILVGHSTFAAANQGLCVFAAIAEQLINLAVFVWLAIFAVDVAIRYHRNANSLQPRSKKRVVITYLLVGWIIPTALTGVGIAANFVSRGAFVQYGLEGSCHINHSQSALALLAIPDLISIFIAVVALIAILVLLCKVHYSFKKKDKCRFVLLFIFYPILAVLWFIWYSTLGGRFSRIVKFFLPFLFLFRSIFFFFMVAFSKKVLKTIRGLLGLQRSKINPSGGGAMKDEPHPEHKEGQRDSVKPFIGEQNQQNIRESFASHLENPMLSSHVSAWEDADRKDIN